MYLLKLFRYNKWLFGFVTTFILVQLFINVKQGLTATPVLHYGMYSGKFFLPDSISTWFIEVNGHPINLTGLSGKRVDHVFEPLNAYYDINVHGINLYHSHIEKYLAVFMIPSRKDTFAPALSRNSFLNWYKQNLEDVLKQKITQIRIYRCNYNRQGANFIQTSQQLYEAIN